VIVFGILGQNDAVCAVRTLGAVRRAVADDRLVPGIRRGLRGGPSSRHARSPDAGNLRLRQAGGAGNDCRFRHYARRALGSLVLTSLARLRVNFDNGHDPVAHLSTLPVTSPEFDPIM